MLPLCVSCVQLPARGCHAALQVMQAPGACLMHSAGSLSRGGDLQGVSSETATVTATKEKAGQAPVQSPMEGGPPLAAF